MVNQQLGSVPHRWAPIGPLSGSSERHLRIRYNSIGSFSWVKKKKRKIGDDRPLNLPTDDAPEAKSLTLKGFLKVWQLDRIHLMRIKVDDGAGNESKMIAALPHFGEIWLSEDWIRLCTKDVNVSGKERKGRNFVEALPRTR